MLILLNIFVANYRLSPEDCLTLDPRSVPNHINPRTPISNLVSPSIKTHQILNTSSNNPICFGHCRWTCNEYSTVICNNHIFIPGHQITKGMKLELGISLNPSFLAIKKGTDVVVGGIMVG